MSAIAAAKKTRLPITIAGDDPVQIPSWVVDHQSYRRWAWSDQFPEHGGISYLDGTLWVDLGMEEFFMHNQVKARISLTLMNLLEVDDLGQFVPDGRRLVCRRNQTVYSPSGIPWSASESDSSIGPKSEDRLSWKGPPTWSWKLSVIPRRRRTMSSSAISTGGRASANTGWSTRALANPAFRSCTIRLEDMLPGGPRMAGSSLRYSGNHSD